jgi:hypothetical protein
MNLSLNEFKFKYLKTKNLNEIKIYVKNVKNWIVLI